MISTTRSSHSKEELFIFMEVTLHYMTCNDIVNLLNVISYTDIPQNFPIIQQEMIVKFVPNVSFFYGEHSATWISLSDSLYATMFALKNTGFTHRNVRRYSRIFCDCNSKQQSWDALQTNLFPWIVETLFSFWHLMRLFFRSLKVFLNSTFN